MFSWYCNLVRWTNASAEQRDAAPVFRDEYEALGFLRSEGFRAPPNMDHALRSALSESGVFDVHRLTPEAVIRRIAIELCSRTLIISCGEVPRHVVLPAGSSVAEEPAQESEAAPPGRKEKEPPPRLFEPLWIQPVARSGPDAEPQTDKELILTRARMRVKSENLAPGTSVAFTVLRADNDTWVASATGHISASRQGRRALVDWEIPNFLEQLDVGRKNLEFVFKAEVPGKNLKVESARLKAFAPFDFSV